MNVNHYCSVPRCNSWAKRNPELSFHLFPKTGKQRVSVETVAGNKVLMDRRKAWILKLRMGKPVSHFMKVCSLHFTKRDYFYREEFSTKRKILKKTAVPSINLPLQIDNAIPGPSARYERANKRNLLKEVINVEALTDTLCECEAAEDPQHNEDDIEAAESLLQLLHCQPNFNGPRKYRDFQVQVNTPKILTLCDLIKTDSALNSFTGLQNFELLECLVEAVQFLCVDQRLHRLTIKERIMLLLTKLKCNLTNVTLSTLYGISPELCKNYIFEMLPIVSRVLRPTINFPSSMEIKRNMPKCFEDFQNVRVILDCTEIFIQKPKCLCCRIRFYSQYKSNLTVKFMTGVSPGGIITFVSEPYGGRASDKTIFEQSDIILKLNSSKDAIMVDKGFLVDDICEKFKIKLIRPPFLKDKRQLSAEEALLNSKIAAARVHIERANQRIKIFKILNGKVQWSLVPKIMDIFTIACGITNLSTPILADCRFLTDKN